MRTHSFFCAFTLLLSTGMSLLSVTTPATVSPPDASEAAPLWKLAQSKASIHRFSTLFTAQDMRSSLSSPEGLEKAMAWCKATGVTHVYLETFRDGYQAPREVMLKARDAFKEAGFLVSGCVTTTGVGKPSTGWKDVISCYTDQPTQEKIQAIFEYTASMFDEIMIDDFWFTDCSCPACEKARQDKTVTIGTDTFPVAGNTWEDYRCALMTQMSRHRVLKPACKINPKCRIIIKYPQWYDNFHERGYEVLGETRDFDKIWVGTETRDYGDKQWGGTVQYEAFFIMRWLGGIGGAKCGGGWYDWLGTTEQTYVEQARQTILGGARESLLFCYGGLQGTTGPKNIEALRNHAPELLDVAAQVAKRKPAGLAAYKPANSHPEKEARVFDFVGMMGLPLVPCHEFPSKAPAAFFSIHAMKDPQLPQRLEKYIRSGRHVLLTDGLARQLAAPVDHPLISRATLEAANVHILKVNGDPKSLLTLGETDLNALREPLLQKLGITFKAPGNVGLYWFKDGSWVVENFNATAITANLNGQVMDVAPRSWKYHWK